MKASRSATRRFPLFPAAAAPFNVLHPRHMCGAGLELGD
jgi:hypothetical protein